MKILLTILCLAVLYGCQTPPQQADKTFEGTWKVRWIQGKEWYPEDGVEMTVAGESSFGLLDGNVKSVGLAPDWGLYGKQIGNKWQGRWWAAPDTNIKYDSDFSKPINITLALSKDYALNQYGSFTFVLSDDGNTFTGTYDRASDTSNVYKWVGYKICNKQVCTNPIKGNKFP